MSMSDWSSDVCSSDLRAKLISLAGREPGDLENPKALAYCEGLGNAIDRILLQQGDVSVLRDWKVPQFPLKGGQRSEEHTSELQSLMRISYAVFCLKQKTTNLNDYKQCNTTRTHYNDM